MTRDEVRIALVGDFNPANTTHIATNEALDHLALAHDWVATDRVGDAATRLPGYAGIFIAPASPYRSLEGAVDAVRYARERGVPLVGT
jgi:CTP synthase (UTP-ammonia lyase)